MKHNTIKTMVAGAAVAASLAFSGSALAKVEGDTIILGSAISLTGKYATNGLHTQRGYDYAVKVINEKGGVNVGGKSYKLAVKYYDDESTPARGAQLAERLIQQDGVDYMLGPYSSGLTKAIAPVSEKFGVPMVEAEGASRSLFTQGYRYLFGVLSTTDLYLPAAIEMAAASTNDPTKLRVAVAFEGDPFTADIRIGVLEKLAEFGMQVIVDDQLPADLSDMSTTLTKVKALKPDMLIVSGHSKGAATAVRQLDEMKVNIPIVALTHCEAAKVQEKFPKTATGLLWASAAVIVFKEAFEAANSFDKDKVRDAISAVEMETFYGNIKFSEAGNNIAKPMFMRQIQADGSYKLVEKFSDMIFPRNIDY
ncbi:MAG: amino acid ABC transporter substrate-binding protein [Alphaproteobacteria bacterium]|nr:amino acid ABC transporter substrate-binding protein [Alphaproteobacteria bacterium]